jgi:predicted RNA binding protein YcfA (HicA-like mRNA interferase family)
MSGPERARELRHAGWVLDRARGIHHVFKHPEAPVILVVPHPKQNLGPGLTQVIRRQADL